MKPQHNAHKNETRQTGDDNEDNREGIHFDAIPKIGRIFISAHHDHHAHDRRGDNEHHQGQ